MLKDVTFTQDELSNVKKMPINPEYKNIQLYDLNQLRENTPMPLNYVLHPWLPEQGIAFIYAASGAGKTFFTLNAAYAIAGGGNFLKYSAPEPRKVLYVDGEMSFTQLHERIMLITKQQGDLDDPTNFFVLSAYQAHPTPIPKLCDPAGRAYYEHIINEKGFDVIIFDNLSTLSNIDTSDPVQWKPIQDWLLSLRSQGKSTIIVHHAGKDKSGYLGTSRMLHVLDAAISLQVIKDNDVEEADAKSLLKLKVVYDKARHFHGVDAHPFEAIMSDMSWEYRAIELSTFERVIDCYNENLTQREIARELNVAQSLVSKYIKRAKQQGRIGSL